MSDASNSELESAPAEEVARVGLMDGLVTLIALPFSPRASLEILFLNAWPRFLITLLIAYLLIPLWAYTHLDPSRGYGELFIRLNKQVAISPQEFKHYLFLVSAFGLVSSVLVFGLLQRFLAFLFREPLALLDSVASFVYATVPFFFVSLAKYLLDLLTDPAALVSLGTTENNGLSALLQPLSGFGLVFLAVLQVVALFWGCVIWFKAMGVVSDMVPERILGIGVLLVLIPSLILLTGIAVHLLSVTVDPEDLGEILPDVEQLREHLHYDPRR